MLCLEATGINHKAVCKYRESSQHVDQNQLCPCQCNLSTSTPRVLLSIKTKPSVVRQRCENHLLKAGVVPGVLQDFHVKRVLNLSSTARTVTVIYKERGGNPCETAEKLPGTVCMPNAAPHKQDSQQQFFLNHRRFNLASV